jgi:hypothetical protein
MPTPDMPVFASPVVKAPKARKNHCHTLRFIDKHYAQRSFALATSGLFGKYPSYLQPQRLGPLPLKQDTKNGKGLAAGFFRFRIPAFFHFAFPIPADFPTLSPLILGHETIVFDDDLDTEKVRACDARKRMRFDA